MSAGNYRLSENPSVLIIRVKHLTLKDKGIVVFPKAGNFAQSAISTISNESQILCVSVTRRNLLMLFR
jgi:hypothetical protein